MRMSDAILLLVTLPVAMGLLLLGGWGLTVGRNRDACCANCRYPTAGLPDPHLCPECGADLRARGGTLAPDTRRILYPPRPLAIVCRILIVVAAAGFFYRRSVELFPVLASHCTASAASGAGLFTSVTVRAGGAVRCRGDASDWRRNRVVCTPLTARLRGPARTVTLRLDTPYGPTHYDAPADAGATQRVTVNDGPSPDLILSWMQAAGVNSAHLHAPREAAAILALINHVAADGGVGPEPAPSPPHFLAGLGALNGWGGRDLRPHRAVTAATLLIAGFAAVILVRPVLRWPSPVPR